MTILIENSELGKVWLSLLNELVTMGEKVGDEILELLSVSVSFGPVTDQDSILSEFADDNNIQEMRKVFFTSEQNAFGHNYKENIVGPLGRNDFQDIVELLRENPACKRALISIIGNKKGKVPCINVVHFLLREEGLVIVYFARGQDIFNKFYADAISISDMAQIVAKQLGVNVFRISGLISSAHIYLNDLPKIKDILARAK